MDYSLSAPVRSKVVEPNDGVRPQTLCSYRVGAAVLGFVPWPLNTAFASYSHVEATHEAHSCRSSRDRGPSGLGDPPFVPVHVRPGALRAGALSAGASYRRGWAPAIREGS